MRFPARAALFAAALLPLAAAAADGGLTLKPSPRLGANTSGTSGSLSQQPAYISADRIEGTSDREVMAAGKAAGVERIVYTSSVAALRPPGAGAADETARMEQRDAIGAYKQSKIAAEREVERMIAGEGLPAIIVSPSTPIGPGDVRPTPTGRIVIEAAMGRMPAFVDTGLNLVHVDDEIGRAHV